MRIFLTGCFFAFLLGSCVSDGFDKPSKNQIINDLVFNSKNGQKINVKDEIMDFNITQTKINSTDLFSYNDDELEIKLNIEFIDIYTNKIIEEIQDAWGRDSTRFKRFKIPIEYSGEILMTYRLDNNLNWAFHTMTEEIKEGFNPGNLDIPSKNQIIADLIDENVGDWTFARESEFLNINIYDQKIISGSKMGNYNLKLKIKMELQDYRSGEYYTGDITMDYQTNKNKGKWSYKGVSGEVNHNAYKISLIDRVMNRLESRSQ